MNDTMVRLARLTLDAVHAPSANRRAAPRYGCKLKAEIAALPDSTGKTWQVNVADISTGGVLLTFCPALKPGILLKLRFGGGEQKLLRVRHCRLDTTLGTCAGCSISGNLSTGELKGILGLGPTWARR